MNKIDIFWGIYLLCVVYCLWRLSRRYKKSSLDGITGYTPGLDLLVIIILAPVIAPADLIVTLIRRLKRSINGKR